MTESAAVRVDPSNAGQLDAWDGAQGEVWAARAERIDDGVAAYREHFLAAAAIDSAANVLDIGCGSGQTTRDAARHAAAGSALGVDLSSPMLDLARVLAAKEQVPNATFRQADVQIEPFADGSFDVAISRHGAMFFGDERAAFTNIARALRPGGGLALLTWQSFQRNEWLRAFRAAFAGGRELPPPAKPFALSDPDQVRDLLTSAGFTRVRVLDRTEPMYFGRDVDDAFDFVCDQHGGLMKGLDADGRARALDALRVTLSEHETDKGVLYESAAWVIEARRG
ncbi:class I SAM-dependent methyltransferase [Amycolatopsis sp. H20-H5]|uniref:class I SAM-dependent methyltransferase n=1 Tax=Amycolatopsis sp. H20-H5 TaxID=3046309 RepID=UPI002DB99F7D|nr:class I SAM-dependent methyltransferase [Amycolatopsis sp. H20-H5]MEC3978269.1 class I SAM-dependent methyltransferase [Amycolatopsis sp. H20-H5]